MLPVAFRLFSAPRPHRIVSTAPNLRNDETPGHEAYPLGYSFYTGVRRRSDGGSELYALRCPDESGTLLSNCLVIPPSVAVGYVR